MIAEECPNIPHRYCSNHFIRDLAKQVLEKDSHAKGKSSRKIRGLRTIEKEIMAELDQYQEKNGQLTHEQQTSASHIVLDYCAAIRGILNDNHGGPLTPPGLRMAKALEEVEQKIERNMALPIPIYSALTRLHGYIKRGLSIYYTEQKEIKKYVKEIEFVTNTLDSETGTAKKRLAKFRRLKLRLSMSKDSVKNHMSEIMHSFEAGLFVGDDNLSIPEDNLDLERWFKKPKGHERKIHGHKH
jgi:hypothetical protein